MKYAAGGLADTQTALFRKTIHSFSAKIQLRLDRPPQEHSQGQKHFLLIREGLWCQHGMESK